MSQDVRQELDLLREKVQADLPFRSTPPFHIGIASEPTVQVLFRDFVEPGAFVFDVGAHIGSLTQALSRIVGPFGRVISIEANPQTIPFLVANLVKNALFNCFVLNEAMWHTANHYVNVLEGGAASSVSEANDGVGLIKTTTLDDLCTRFGHSPSFLKIDIEGAEYEALRGATKLLERQHPTIVFEHNVGDDRALGLLRDLNYWTMNASTYDEVTSSSELDPACNVTNILAIPNTAAARRYQKAQVVFVADFTKFEKIEAPGSLKYKVQFDLDPGRYIITIDAGCDSGATVYTRVTFNGLVLGELCTNFEFFMKNHKDMVFHAETSGRYTFEVGEHASSFVGCLTLNWATLRKVSFQ